MKQTRQIWSLLLQIQIPPNYEADVRSKQSPYSQGRIKAEQGLKNSFGKIVFYSNFFILILLKKVLKKLMIFFEKNEKTNFMFELSTLVIPDLMKEH